jgi:hypothetical protein
MAEEKERAKRDRRSPGTYTREDRANAIAILNDPDRVLLEFRDACILLEYTLLQGYRDARAGIAQLKEEGRVGASNPLFPGAILISPRRWKVSRQVLYDLLYGIECEECRARRYPG